MTVPAQPFCDDALDTKPYPKPLKTSGALDRFKYSECSPALGREYHGLQLSSIIDDDEIVRDLAITSKSPRNKEEKAGLTDPFGVVQSLNAGFYFSTSRISLRQTRNASC
jgi:hypothetical protein